MYYGAAQLLGYETGYNRKLYRFADYNAGRYASRNAALQMVVQKLSGETLALDGDFLSYASTGKASPTPTATEKAVLKAVAKHALGLSEKDVRKDLLKEKTPEFVKTATFLKLRAAYRLATGQEAPFAIVPDIRLSSPKITHMMTTRIFAESVERRYQACMKVK
jgi:hypothetical protein